jgi:hypothetical protein
MKGPDLNDLHREKGEEAVRTASDSARSFEPDDFGPDEQAHAEGNGEADGEWEPPRNPWTVPVLSWRDPETIPRRVFLYGHCYARGFVSATIADGGVGKSLFKIVEFLACATRRPLLGITPTERIRVLYWNGDDPYVEIERRIHAACQHYSIDLKRLLAEGWLFVGTRDKQPLCLAEMKGRSVALNQSTIDDLCAFIRQKDIGLACFDPLRSVHRLPENNNDDMDIIGDAFNVIAERTNAAIGLDHHIRKMASGQSEVTAADARGATALINKVRLSRVLNPMTSKLAKEARIKEDERRRYFRADGGKANIAPATKARWFKIVSVPCANGEDTPTIVVWSYPSPFDSVTAEHMQQVRAMAADGNYRKDSRAEDWIGRAVAKVLDLDLENQADRKQVKTILKTWFTNRVLTTKNCNDKTRRPRVYVVPGDWADEEPNPAPV